MAYKSALSMSAEYAENNLIVIKQEIRDCQANTIGKNYILVDFGDEITGDVLTFVHETIPVTVNGMQANGYLIPCNEKTYNAWFSGY